VELVHKGREQTQLCWKFKAINLLMSSQVSTGSSLLYRVILSKFYQYCLTCLVSFIIANQIFFDSEILDQWK